MKNLQERVKDAKETTKATIETGARGFSGQPHRRELHRDGALVAGERHGADAGGAGRLLPSRHGAAARGSAFVAVVVAPSFTAFSLGETTDRKSVV